MLALDVGSTFFDDDRYADSVTDATRPPCMPLNRPRPSTQLLSMSIPPESSASSSVFPIPSRHVLPRQASHPRTSAAPIPFSTRFFSSLLDRQYSCTNQPTTATIASLSMHASPPRANPLACKTRFIKFALYLYRICPVLFPPNSYGWSDPCIKAATAAALPTVSHSISSDIAETDLHLAAYR
jgi:hypothetical protein